MAAVVLLAGPCCAGKTTIQKMLAKRDDVSFIKLATTRYIRCGDCLGGIPTYEYFDKDWFNYLSSQGLIVGATEYARNYYGARGQEIFDILSQNEFGVIEANQNVISAFLEFCQEKNIKIFVVLIVPFPLEDKKDIVLIIKELERRMRWERDNIPEDQIPQKLNEARRFCLWALKNQELFDYTLVTFSGKYSFVEQQINMIFRDTTHDA